MPTKRISEEKRSAIEADLNDKLTQRAIAKKYKVAIGTVSNIAAKFIKTPEDQPDPTNQQILKLEAQVIALKDENNRCKLAYKTAQRKNSVFEALVDETET